MAKKGPLSKDEKKYIEDYQHLSVDEIAEKLNRSESSIKKHIASLEDKPEAKAGNLMARNKKYGATMMTENASIAGDESKSKVKPDRDKINIAKRHRGSIHRIKED
tara:strand:+ start:1692 stop:2009 length:318 start_codon:yes stop_codon:yes gene_type:complete